MALSAAQKKAIEVAVGSRKGEEPAVSSAIAGAAAMQAVAAIATVDATDLATAEALANACKAKINEMLAAVKNG